MLVDQIMVFGVPCNCLKKSIKLRDASLRPGDSPVRRISLNVRNISGE
jgi:hypothetical protein